MRKNKIIYWVTTGIISLMMLFSAYSYLTNPEMKEGFTQMGFKDFFRIELAVAKFLGVLVLIIPAVPKLIKGFAYAGFAITFVSAFIAHSANGDPTSAAIMPLIFLLMLGVSYYYQLKVFSGSTVQASA